MMQDKGSGFPLLYHIMQEEMDLSQKGNVLVFQGNDDIASPHRSLVLFRTLQLRWLELSQLCH